MLELIQAPDRIIIQPDGTVEIETPAPETWEDGKLVGPTGLKHRRVIAPDDDIDAELDVIEGATRQDYGNRVAIKRLMAEGRSPERVARYEAREGRAGRLDR